VWRLYAANGEMESILELYDHESPALSVALRSKLVVAGAEDGQLLIWDARDVGVGSDGPVGRYTLDDAVSSVAIQSGPSGDTVFAADRSGLVVELAFNGDILASYKLDEDIADLLVFDARPDLSQVQQPGTLILAGPVVLAAVGDGDIVILDWSDRFRVTLLAQHKGHNSAVAALCRVAKGVVLSKNSPKTDDDDDDAIENYVISAAEDCTLKAWCVARLGSSAEEDDDDDLHDDDDDDQGDSRRLR